MKWYRKAAEQGDATKQRELAFLYWLDRDNVEAAKWYLKAAERGNADAQFNLGDMYRDGKGVPQNYAEAAKWYRKAAESEVVEKTDLTRAMSADSLGKLYEDGLGVPQDYIEAAKWYRKAAGGSNSGVSSMFSLCLKGKATKRDCADVAEWLAILANRDGSFLYPANVYQFYLGQLYEKGLGVLQDYVEAAKWYRKAADQGNAGAQLLLGNLYVIGRGVPQDIVAAHMWFNLSASLSGDGERQKSVADLRDGLAKMMTPARIRRSPAPSAGVEAHNGEVKQDSLTQSRSWMTATLTANRNDSKSGIFR